MRDGHKIRRVGVGVFTLVMGLMLLKTPFWESPDVTGAGACTDEQLFEWAQGKGAYTENVVLGDFAFEDSTARGRYWWKRVRMRRGLMATKDLKRGDVVVSVPEDLLFSPQAANQTELREVLREVPDMDSFAILALFLLQERDKGAASAYWPYVCQMPRSFSTTAFWPLQQVLDAGTDSNVYLMTRRFEAALLQEYNKLMPLLFRLFPTRFSTRTHSFRSWVWAKTCVFSRNWGISDPRVPPNRSIGGIMSERWRGHVAYGSFSFAMVPVADLLNHDNGDQGNIAWLHSLAAGDIHGASRHFVDHSLPTSSRRRRQPHLAVVGASVPSCPCRVKRACLTRRLSKFAAQSHVRNCKVESQRACSRLLTAMYSCMQPARTTDAARRSSQPTETTAMLASR